MDFHDKKILIAMRIRVVPKKTKNKKKQKIINFFLEIYNKFCSGGFEYNCWI
jgi:hypothetical protein